MYKVKLKNLIQLFLLLFLVKRDRRAPSVLYLRSLQETYRQGTLGKPFASPNLHTSTSDPDKDYTRDGADDAPGGSYDQPCCGLLGRY